MRCVRCIGRSQCASCKAKERAQIAAEAQASEENRARNAKPVAKAIQGRTEIDANYSETIHADGTVWEP